MIGESFTLFVPDLESTYRIFQIKNLISLLDIINAPNYMIVYPKCSFGSFMQS